MKLTRFNKSLSAVLCIVLVAAMALFTIGCGDNQKTDNVTSDVSISQSSNVLGEGQTKFTFKTTDLEGKESEFEIHTDKKTVGEALVEVGLIAGEDSAYGLYVKTVNGVTLDYDKDGKYWAFYVDGEYASTGVDSTDVKEGSVYAFKAE